MDILVFDGGKFIGIVSIDPCTDLSSDMLKIIDTNLGDEKLRILYPVEGGPNHGLLLPEYIADSIQAITIKGIMN